MIACITWAWRACYIQINWYMGHACVIFISGSFDVHYTLCSILLQCCGCLTLWSHYTNTVLALLSNQFLPSKALFTLHCLFFQKQMLVSSFEILWLFSSAPVFDNDLFIIIVTTGDKRGCFNIIINQLWIWRLFSSPDGATTQMTYTLTMSIKALNTCLVGSISSTAVQEQMDKYTSFQFGDIDHWLFSRNKRL